MKRRTLQWIWLTVLGVSLAAACGEDGVVGGDCLDGYVACEGRCVDPDIDARHCGVCGNTCSDGVTCRRGQCDSGGTSAGGDAGASGAAGADSGGSSGAAGGSGSGTGGAGTGGAGTGGAGTGGVGTGGAGTGGAGTGGVGTGGAGTGGVGTGGAGTGGAGTGGVGTGGVGTGGVGTGGVGTGGVGTGGVGTGGVGTGGVGTGGVGTGGVGTGGVGTGGVGTGGVGTGGVGTGGVGGSPCLPPFNTAEACGDCDTQCEGGTPFCAPADGGGFECVPICDEGLTRCAFQCVDLQTDPRNCGTCFNICPSGVCEDAICLGSTPGHVVYACMNYAEVFLVSSQVTLLGNAVFLPRREPVRVLAYSEHADAEVMAATDRAIRWAGAELSRTAEITRVEDVAEIETELILSNYDVFLVYDQPNAATGELASAGAQLATTVTAFTRGGGVAVLLSGATGIGEMGEFATSAGLAAIGTETPYSSLAYIQGSGDVLTVDVVAPFQTLESSCTFATSEIPSSDTIFVFTDTDPTVGVGEPIVLHRVVTP